MILGYMPKIAHVVPVQRGILPHLYLIDVPDDVQNVVLPDDAKTFRLIDVKVDFMYHKLFHVTPTTHDGKLNVVLTSGDVPFETGEWIDKEKKIWKVKYYSLILYKGDFKKISLWRTVLPTDRITRPNVGLNMTAQDVQFLLERPEKVWPYEHTNA